MKRNDVVDIIRGVAMLMVVLGHTISSSTSEYENTFIFRVIWSLQMPLFFIISGYVTRYSRPIENGMDLWRFISKRTLAYLLPWIVWTFVVRGFIFGQEDFLDVRYLLWHMDSGYWFLVTLWCIVVIYGVSDYLSNKLAKRSKGFNILMHLACMVGGACILIGVGCVAGMSFLDIKLTLYYIPMYAFGYLYGQLQDSILTKHRATSIVETIIVLSLAVWLWLLVRVNFYGVDATLGLLSMRYIASLCGSIFIIYTLSIICKSGGVFVAVGKYSLEIYTTHYLFLNLLSVEPTPALATTMGVLTIVENYTLTLALTTITIIVLRHNRLLSKLLFFKRAEQEMHFLASNGAA